MRLDFPEPTNPVTPTKLFRRTARLILLRPNAFCEVQENWPFIITADISENIGYSALVSERHALLSSRLRTRLIFLMPLKVIDPLLCREKRPQPRV